MHVIREHVTVQYTASNMQGQLIDEDTEEGRE